MNPKATINALRTQREERLSVFPLYAERQRVSERSSHDTHDMALPFSLLDTLPLTPDDADALTGANAFTEWIAHESDAAAHKLLQSDLDALDALSAGSRMEVNRPFGFKETLFAVRSGDAVVGILWSGKYRVKELARDDLQSEARAIHVQAKTLAAALDKVPIMTQASVLRHLNVMSALQSAVEWGYRSQDKYRDGIGQLKESERVRALGTLSSGVAHHFNNLLSVILGYSSFLLNRAQLSEEATKALRQISEAAQKGRRLTEEILSFAGSEVEQETACSVHEILLSVLSLLETQTAGRVQVTHELSATRDTVRAPRSVLHQTVYNLLTNAIDSMPTGGDLAISTQNVRLPVGDADTEHIRIEVLDSGSGPFTASASAGAAKKSKLSSLYGMIDQLDGSAVLSSEEGFANRAEVLLPLDREMVEIAPPRKARKRLAPSVIWIVDDDPIFREMCDRVLSDDGHEVVCLSSGPELHAAWGKTKRPPQLLIIDFSMPDYNGLELCTWLREQGSKAPVILVSGFSHTQPDIHKALKMRKTYFLQKPFPVPELADIVTVALGETLLGS